VNKDELAAYAAWAQTLSPVELDAHITLLEARETVAEEGLADVRWQLGMHRRSPVPSRRPSRTD
jgi:hypothetical protein